MAKVVLVRFPYSDIYSVYGRLPKKREIRPPLGLIYLAGALEEDNHEVVILDAEASGIEFKKLFDLVMRERPDFVGMTATTPEIHKAWVLSRLIKYKRPEVTTIVGGAHVSALPEETIKQGCVDYVVVGEGEKAIRSIVNSRPTNRIIQCPELEDLSGLPQPARHLLNYNHYWYPAPNRGMVKMDVVQSIRGCPFQCSFCFNRKTKPRFRDPVEVVDEIEKTVKDNGVRFVMFLDDTLTLNYMHLFNLCLQIVRHGLNKKVNFFGLVRADTTTKKMLTHMALAGFTEISMGVESGSEALLALSKKGTGRKEIEDVYHWAQELSIQTRGSFILGLPYETALSISLTIEFAKSLSLMRASCNILTPYPGTKIFEQAKAGGWGLTLLTDDWREFKRWGTSVIETDSLNKGELEESQRQFLTEFYSQPKVLGYHLKQFLKGNRSSYYFRPLRFALKNKLRSAV